VQDILMGKDVPRHPGQTDREELDMLQLQNRSNHNRIRVLREHEGVRLRGLNGETPVAKAKREANEAKREANAKEKADAKAKAKATPKAKASPKAKATPRAKATPKAKAATGSVAQSAPAPATVDDLIKYCNELVEENVEESVTAAAQETLGLLAEYGDDFEQCKVLVDSLIKLAAEARNVPAVDAPPVGAGQWPIGEACEDKTAGGRKCGKKDGCAHRKAFADAAEAEQKRAKTQEEVKVQDKFWDEYRTPKTDLVRYWAG
jgi:hypothetical protein